MVGTFAYGFVSPGRPLRPSAVICSPFAEEIAPCAPAAPAATDHTEKEGQRDLDIPYPSSYLIFTYSPTIDPSTTLGAPLLISCNSSYLFSSLLLFLSTTTPQLPILPSRPKKGTPTARNLERMELDFDDIDIPISDARLSHLSPVPSSAVPVNAANNLSSSGIGSKRGHKAAGRKGADAGSNVLDKQLQGADQDDHDLEDGLLVGDDDVMDGTGLMDWQSIDTGGECIKRGSEQLDTATLMTSFLIGLLLFCSRNPISP